MKICLYDSALCDMSVMPITSQDYPKIQSFLLKTFPHMAHRIPIWNGYIRQYGENIVLKNSKNEIKGFLNIEVDHNIGNINFIAVDPSLQGKGIGAKLLSFAEKKLKDKTDILNLHTEGNKLKNMQFYSKNGWKIHSIDQKGYEHTTSVKFIKK